MKAQLLLPLCLSAALSQAGAQLDPSASADSVGRKPGAATPADSVRGAQVASAAPATQPADPAATPAATPAAAPAPAAPVAAPAALDVAIGTVRFSGLVQAWYTSGTPEATSTFRVRRAEMRFTGAISGRARWLVMVDPAKSLRVTDGKVNQSSAILQDAFVSFSAKGLDIQAGQTIVPLGYEGTVGSAKLETVERTAFIADGKLAAVRDLGVLMGREMRLATVKVGLFNGLGDTQNSTDANGQKIAAARLELRTPVTGLVVSGSGAWGGVERGEAPRRDRVGADVMITRGAFTSRAEWMRGWDGDVPREGYYALATYRVRDVQLVGRYDAWDRDTRTELATADARERDYVAGLNYLIAGTNVRVQASQVLRTFRSAPTQSFVQLCMQASW